MAKKQQSPKTTTSIQGTQTNTVKTEMPTKTGMAAKFSPILKLSLILGILTFIVYFNTLQNGFVLDDSMVYSKNTIVNQGFGGIGELFQTPRLKGFGYLKNENYRPLSLVMFAIEVGIFGLNPAVSHFFNVLFFAGCVILLFIFLDKLFERKKTMVAFMAALIFAVHPIHTEVVSNIKSLDEIFCFLFAFLSQNVLVDYMKSGKMWQLAAGLVALFLSYLSKETVVTFLGIIPLVFFFYLNDDRKRAIIMTAGALVVTGIYLAIRHKILSDYGASTSAVEFIDNALVAAPSTAMRLATAFFTLGMYVKLLFIPHPLISDYGFNSVPYVGFGNIWVILSVAIYVAAGVVGLYRLIKNPKDPWAFGILFFLATIALFSNIFFLMGSAMGERFLFFASAGFCLLVALAIDKWLIKSDVSFESFMKHKTALAILIPVCVIYSGLTIARNAEWKDNYTMFKADLEKSPNNARLNYYVGNELVENVLPNVQDSNQRKEILNESVTCLNRAIEILKPDHTYTDAHTELGTAYLNLLRYDSAERHFQIAISQNEYQSIAANNLGTVYLRTNHILEAIAAYKLAIKIKADFVQAYCNLGSCYARINQFDSAIITLNQCLSINPNYPEAYMQLGLAYYFSNKFTEAEPYFKKALELNPSDLNAANNLGAVYLNSGKYQQGAEIFKQLIAANPSYVNGYSNLGHCYYEMKRYEAAIDIINKSLTLDPNNVKDIPYIALSYKALGRMDEARKYEAIAQKYYANFKL